MLLFLSKDKSTAKEIKNAISLFENKNMKNDLA